MSVFLSFGRRLRFGITTVCVVLVLASCQLAKNQLEYDRSAELDRQDYRDTLAPIHLEEKDEPPVPAFQPVLSTPQELRLPSPLVTVSVNQTVSLRDLLFELSDQAQIDLELDPQIRGSIIFTARERPFDEVVDRISEMAGLRYNFKNGVLRVELDRPYVKNYDVGFLNVVRTGDSKVETETALGASSGASSGGNEGGSTSGESESKIEAKYEGNIWKDLEENIEQILTSSDTYISLATLSDPVSQPFNPMPPPPVSNDPNNPTPPPLPGSPQVSAMPAAVAPTLNITAAPAEPLVPNPPATFSISRQSGMMSVFASERQQKDVATFLNRFKRHATTQVLIEAKVLQVQLTDEFSSGINWDTIDLTGKLRVTPSFPSPGIAGLAGNGFTALFETNNFDALIGAVSRFGTVRALSSPRVTVMNNQPAIVNVVENNVYFSLDVETVDDDDTNTQRVTIDSTQESAPEGVILNVMPSANPDTGEITMIVRPTVTSIASQETDPTIPFALAALGLDPDASNVPPNQIPELFVQEIDSMLRMQSGQIMVMGGLMQDENRVTEEAVPVLGDLPFVGSAFKNHTDTIVKSELVVFIRARIIPGSNIEEMDRKLYKDMALDRRPARL